MEEDVLKTRSVRERHFMLPLSLWPSCKVRRRHPDFLFDDKMSYVIFLKNKAIFFQMIII